MSTYVAVFALVLAYVALVAAFLALRTLSRLRRATAVLSRGARGPEAQASLIEATQQNTERTELVAEELADLRALVAESVRDRAVTDPLAGRPDTKAGKPVAAPDPGALRNVALVRYDALGEMSGRMSFSLALLDERGDGVTISAIAGPADTRVYAKGVTDGKGEHELSPEEQEAVRTAIGRRRGLRRSA